MPHDLRAVFSPSPRYRQTACRDKIALGLQSAADRASATKAEAELQKRLTSQLRQIQASANQKYARDPKNKPQLRAYWIGSGLAVNRATLQEAAHDILDKLAADALPGVTTEFRNGVRTTLDAWKTANENQAAASGVRHPDDEAVSRPIAHYSPLPP